MSVKALGLRLALTSDRVTSDLLTSDFYPLRLLHSAESNNLLVPSVQAHGL